MQASNRTITTYIKIGLNVHTRANAGVTAGQVLLVQVVKVLVLVLVMVLVTVPVTVPTPVPVEVEVLVPVVVPLPELLEMIGARSAIAVLELELTGGISAIAVL